MKKLLIVSLCVSVIAIVISGVSIGMTINTHSQMKSYYSQTTNNANEIEGHIKNIDKENVTKHAEATGSTGSQVSSMIGEAGIDIQVQDVFVKSKSIAKNGVHQVEFKIPSERATRTVDVDALDYNEIKAGQDNKAVVSKDMKTQKVTVYFMTENFKKTHPEIYNKLV